MLIRHGLQGLTCQCPGLLGGTLVAHREAPCVLSCAVFAGMTGLLLSSLSRQGVISTEVSLVVLTGQCHWQAATSLVGSCVLDCLAVDAVINKAATYYGGIHWSQVNPTLQLQDPIILMDLQSASEALWHHITSNKHLWLQLPVSAVDAFLLLSLLCLLSLVPTMVPQCCLTVALPDSDCQAPCKCHM